MPRAARALTAWIFAAINSVRAAYPEFDRDRPVPRRSRIGRSNAVPERCNLRSRGSPHRTEAWLARDYLEDRFTVADLLMTTVLRIPRHCDLVAQYPALDAYRLRCEAPAGVQARAGCADGRFCRDAGGGVTPRPFTASAPVSRRDSRRTRAGSCGRASRPRRISPAADRAGISNRRGPRAAPA